MKYDYKTPVNKQINRMLKMKLEDEIDPKELKREELQILIKKNKAALEAATDEFIDSVADLKVKDFPYFLGSVPSNVYYAEDLYSSKFYFQPIINKLSLNGINTEYRILTIYNDSYYNISDDEIYCYIIPEAIYKKFPIDSTIQFKIYNELANLDKTTKKEIKKETKTKSTIVSDLIVRTPPTAPIIAGFCSTLAFNLNLPSIFMVAGAISGFDFLQYYLKNKGLAKSKEFIVSYIENDVFGKKYLEDWKEKYKDFFSDDFLEKLQYNKNSALMQELKYEEGRGFYFSLE